MISIKSIDRHIGHESSVGVCFAKRLRIYCIGKGAMVTDMFARSRVDGGSVGLVLVFAATREGEGVREEWPKSCDVITFCVNRFWGLFRFSFQVKNKILLCSLKLSHSNFNFAISKPYRTCPYGKFGFEMCG